MLKFFQKYNKIILAVGGTLLMIVFLLPAGGEMFMPDPRKQPIGHVNGTDLTVGDRQIAATELRLLGALGLAPHDDATAWLLTRHEARRHGVYASRGDALELIGQLAEFGQDPRQVLAPMNATEAFLIRALRHRLMYEELHQMVTGLDYPSLPRLRHFARDTQSTATVRLAAVDADQLLDDVDPPTEEQMREHFEAYREVPPGESEPYGFGYRLEPRVQIEYIAIPLDRVAEAVEIDEVSAQRYYIESRERFMPDPAPPAEDPADAAPEEAPVDAPADEDAPAQPPDAEHEPGDDPADPAETGDEDAAGDGARGAERPAEPLPYRQVRDQVIAELTQQEAEAVQDRIVRRIRGSLNEHVRHLPTDAEGYRALDEDHQPPSFERVAEQVQAEFGVLVDVVRIDRWLTISEIEDLEGFGDGGVEAIGRFVPVSDYIALTRELEPESSRLAMVLRPQVGIASHPVTDRAGDQYIFRVRAADGSRPPHSLEEVHERVAYDLHRLRAYERLVERADELLGRAREEGIEALAASLDVEVEEVGPFQGRDLQAMFQRGAFVPPTLPLVGQSAQFVDAVFGLAHRVDEAGGLDAVPPEEAVAVIPVDSAQRVAIVRLVEYEPIDRQRFEFFKQQGVRMMAERYRPDPPAVHPMSLEAVARRVGFREARAAEPEPHDHEDRDRGHQPGRPPGL